MPWPRSTWTSPGWVPAGISTSISPAGPGTASEVPSAACVIVSSTAVCRSSPSRSMPGCGVTPHLHEEIARGTSERAGVPFAAHADALAVGDAGGDLDVDRPLVQRAADAVAGARTATRRCGPRPSQRGQVPLRTNWPKTLCETCWTRPAPPHTSQVTGDVPGAAPLPPHVSQVWATRVANADGDAGERLGERDLGARGDIAAARRPAAARLLAEERLAEERAEDVREVAEVEVGRREAAAAEPFAPVAVVGGAALRVGEHLVRLGRLAEALLGVGLPARRRDGARARACGTPA